MINRHGVFLNKESYSCKEIKEVLNHTKSPSLLKAQDIIFKLFLVNKVIDLNIRP